MLVVDINWDTEGCEEIILPREIELPEGMTDEDEISEYISNVTGFCHKGFRIEQ